jgi:23S rRNA U2552 (ribose-2'-O)-methylase RlmE/FtsJ
MEKVNSSFRDPSGFLFWENNVLYRHITKRYFAHYAHFKKSGLYSHLIDENLLVSHETVSESDESIIIRPEYIPFISYPYEWSFSQLKDAALLTLRIQKIALEYGMTLKDASSYNVQFLNGSPIFIDTLSFETYVAGSPWIAYQQFCQHFLAPLYLMSYKDVRLGVLFKDFIDGIPLDLASQLLPWSSYFSLSALLHIHLHARSQKKFEKDTGTVKRSSFTVNQFKGLLANLEKGIESCSWKPQGTEWVDYYKDDSYSKIGLQDKQVVVEQYLRIIKPSTVWDLGANDGFFSRLAQKLSKQVISFDIDPACVENNYLEVQKNKESTLLPLLLNVTNPSSGIGWSSNERQSLFQRKNADCLLALALVHHLAISNNIPLDYIASYMSSLAQYLIIEFVPKEDKKVQFLLHGREDIFSQYNQQDFENIFSSHFNILEAHKIKNSQRTLYLMKKK